MRLALINAWHTFAGGSAPHLSASIPLACLYLASACKRAGHEVSVVDAFSYGCLPAIIRNGTKMLYYTGMPILVNDKEEVVLVGGDIGAILSILRFCEPDIIGFSVTFSSLHYFLPLIVKAFRINFPNAKLVIGGSHATSAPEIVLNSVDVDYVVAGEGEVSFVKLLDMIEKGEEPKGVPGIYYKKDEQIQSTPYELIENLDDIYPPDYLAIPLDYHYALQGYKQVQMMTSRGCPFNCHFCTVPMISKRKWRAHSAKRVLGELERFVYSGVERILFEDDNMAIDQDRFVDILEGIIRKHWNLSLLVPQGLHVSTLTFEVLKLMSFAGFKEVTISPESGNERVAKEEMNKTFLPCDAKEVVKNIIKAEMRPFVNFVIGMPNERWDEILDTINYARELKELGVRKFHFALATPIVGNKIYKDLVVSSRIKDEVPSFTTYYSPLFDGIDWKAKDLFDLRNAADAELNVG